MSNAASHNLVTVDWDVQDAIIKILPTRIRNYVLYEADYSIDLVSALQAKTEYGLTWDEVLDQMKFYSREMRRADYGGRLPENGNRVDPITRL